MLRSIVFGLSLLSATVLSSTAFADNPRSLQIFVSIDKQSLVLYDGSKVIATSKVSTGKEGHDTPTGIFSVIQKQKYHESNLYSNAPMPWMQRLTWSGIALHESNSVPNYPASHGCVRMPGKFAESLYQMTDRGVHVIITDAEVKPAPIISANLFSPRKPLPAGPLMSDVPLRMSSKDAIGKPTELAMNTSQTPSMTAIDTSGGSIVPVSATPSAEPAAKTAATDPANDAAPLRILITRNTQRNALMDAQGILQYLGFDVGPIDGRLTRATATAIAGFKRWKGIDTKGPIISREFLAELYTSAGREEPPAGRIMVRQGGKPLFSANVDIKEPEQPLGTHFFNATEVDRKAGTVEWQAATLPNDLSVVGRGTLGITPRPDPKAGVSAAATLDRIVIPTDIRERIEMQMVTGTSVTINDEGVSSETGENTDFITLTHETPRA